MATEANINIDKVKEAYRRYPVEHFGTKGMINATSRKLFLEGATWRETHPDMLTVESVLIWLTRKGQITQSDMIKLSKQYLEEH